METRNFWEENGHAVNYNLSESFGREQAVLAVASDDESEFPGTYLKKGKVSRQQDPMSHRIIEKRRRDRMNNCLADLSRLIPPEYLKKGRGRVEKTEIIEMAIRHLKYLQERANGLYHGTNRRPDYAVERQVVEYRTGFQEAVSEAVRYLVEVHGYGPNDGLCVQMAAHLQRHCDHVTKGLFPCEPSQDKPRHQGSSSETTSSSGSSHGYSVKGVIAQAPPPAPPPYSEYERKDQAYPMECDRVPASQLQASTESEVSPEEPLPLDGRRKREPTLRAIRKPDHNEDFLHSYKFKNSIERRFSRSQDEAAGVMARTAYAHGKVYAHKRRRAAKPASSASTSASTSGSGSTEDARDTSPQGVPLLQDTSSESPHHHHYEKPVNATQYVPVFALNALGKYYVPLSVDHACLSQHLGPYDVLDARAAHLAAPLHPVTIHVNFQPCLNYHVKREPGEREWRP